MAPLQVAASKMYAHELADYSDAQLDAYLEKNGRYVEVEDPQNLSKDFIQRLKDRVPRQSEEVPSRPVDMNMVAARLQKISDDDCHSSRLQKTSDDGYQSSQHSSLGTTPEPIPDAEQDFRDAQFERNTYEALVDSGGRPTHPLHRLEDIAKAPGEYSEILSYWQKCRRSDDAEGEEWRVFSPQWREWQDFRQLQRFARGQSAYDHWQTYWEIRRRENSFHHVGDQMKHTYTKRQHDSEWRRFQEEYGNKRVVLMRGRDILWDEFIQHKGPDTEQSGFIAYATTLTNRLANHGFKRTFQLDEDLTKQDKLTTWIEYLGYQYWWYDNYAAYMDRNRPRHDRLWEKLVGSEVLELGETEEDLRGYPAACKRLAESGLASKNRKLAYGAALSAEKAVADPEKSGLPMEELQRRLKAARSTLIAANDRYKSIEKRRDHIREFNQRTRLYSIKKDELELHTVLVRWVLQQVPLIEHEMKTSAQTKAVEGEQRRRKRGRKLEHGEIDTEPPPKRHQMELRKRHRPNLDPSDSKPSAKRSRKSRAIARTAKEGEVVLDKSIQVLKPLRRSPRIAAIKQRLKNSSHE